MHTFTTGTQPPVEVDGYSNEIEGQCHHRAYQCYTPPDGRVEAGCTIDCQNHGETFQDLDRSQHATWLSPPQRKMYPRIRPSQQNLNGCVHARRKNQQDNAKNLDNTHGGSIARSVPGFVAGYVSPPWRLRRVILPPAQRRPEVAGFAASRTSSTRHRKTFCVSVRDVGTSS